MSQSRNIFRYHSSLYVLVLSHVFISQAWCESDLELELDPYYSNIGYYINFVDNDDAIPVVVVNNDMSILGRMVKSTFTMPQTFLVEASVSPLPILGVYTRKNHPAIYDDAEVSRDLNMIQALTAGFEEPYAVSVFLGSVVRFVEPGKSKKIKNRGYSGYLLSTGDQHIINNYMVDDKWYELEWKIKGDQDFNTRTYSWSLRAGIKTHEHDEISDVYYFSFRRNYFDSQSDSLSFVGNSDIEYKVEFTRNGLRLAQQEFFINKRWPTFLSIKSSFSLGVGFILQKSKYMGELASEADDFRFIVRPNFDF